MYNISHHFPLKSLSYHLKALLLHQTTVNNYKSLIQRKCYYILGNIITTDFDL